MAKRIFIFVSCLFFVSGLLIPLNGQSAASISSQELSRKLAFQDKLIKALEARMERLESLVVSAKKEKEAPDYDSGWSDMVVSGMPKNTNRRFDHFLAAQGYDNVDNYIVDLQFKAENGSINNQWYGGSYDYHIATDTFEQQGAYWHDLTNTSIYVARGLTDTVARWVRVRIWVINK